MLEVHQLACLRGERLLFRRLDFAVDAGQLWRVTGSNGVGKTSLLRLLCGLAAPAAGEVRWGGIAQDRDQLNASLLYQGHAAALNDLLTPVENLAFACAMAGAEIRDAQCKDALARIGLARQLELPCKHLSQGQRRRVGLARLLLPLHKPLWILDEPFTALDATVTAQISAAMDAHCAAGGAALFTSHHDVPFTHAVQQLDLEGYAA